ncbi:alpha/beta fold hydrolase [Nocardia rhizosphaerae]|uniref:Alpha/beta fold hydrolase n=1 Tax=Nocardia rhizosphaerae TaxID=1691571 RepID=A0ABV8KYR9_9NOCA
MFTFTSSDDLTIHVRSWLPEVEPVGVVQIAHGMGEHSDRYSHLAGTLVALGYAVYAADHRGHGHSMGAEPGQLGADGWNLLVADQVTLTGLLRERHPAVPITLFGHSLGSFAVQQYLLDHSALVDEVVLCGSTAVDGLFDQIMAAGGDLTAFFNAGFQPTRTDADWISSDEAQVDAYLADPWCGFALDEANMAQLATAGYQRLADPAAVRRDLPMYVMVGDQDPLNDQTRLSDRLVQRYRDAGLTDLTYRIYPGLRHEILNEVKRAEVEADLAGWLTRARG